MAFPFDQSFKLSIEEDTAGSLKHVAGISLSPDAVVESLDRELNLERLHADHLYRVRDGRIECIHHFEALAYYRAGWEEPQLDHAVYVRMKYRLPVFSHLLLMHDRGTPASIPDRIARTDGGLRQALDVNVIRLWKRPAREVLQSGSTVLFPWRALMDASVQEQREAVLQVKATGREGLLMQMTLMGALRYGSREAFIERIGRMLLTRDILRESPLWQEIERDAKAEGEARGEQNGERRAVRLLLETRFGTLPQWVENQLAGADTDALDRWVKRAVSAPSLDSVFD